MVTNRVDVKTAQTRLGHSDPRVTLAIYAQAVEEATDEPPTPSVRCSLERGVRQATADALREAALRSGMRDVTPGVMLSSHTVTA